LALAGTAATLAIACNQMLGIEDAKVDARLSAAGRSAASSAGSSATGATGGSGATGGTDAPTTGGNGAGPATGGQGDMPGSGAGADDKAGTGGTGSDTHQHGSGGSSTQSSGGTQSGSTAGKGSSDNGGEGGNDSGSSGDACDQYCSEIQTACTGEAEQYRDEAQCLKICHFFPMGQDGGSDDNSVSCRLKYLTKTRYALGAEVTAYCRQAGPSGDGKCGTDCEAFCSVMMQVCTPDMAGDNHFASQAECMSTCNGLPAPTVHYSTLDPAVSDGNSSLCRLFHVNSAAMADTEEHCEHAMGHTLCEASP
jgi:hypothetical protein